MPDAIKATVTAIQKQHQDILECCSLLLEAISSSQDGQISERRVKLSALLHANLTTEEAVLNGPMRKLPLSQRPTGYRELANEASELRLAYSKHVGRWNLSAIAADRVQYADDALALIVGVQQHLKKKSALMLSWANMLTGASPSNHQEH